ncbi:uncharacterized protein LOC125747005 isoform X6 [Brienomyrus brachyistius]|uniref:uncharacterized protein LOC125747005 isoform X6 n=1 Tax=Brienomyrus brachyistius TaxID=42636 RepID=UPI0020B31B12|nr:uncharacterized protein LOC125747005 isoform X6 [Brienomyrus brachyistius]
MDPLQQNHQDLRQWLQQNKEVLCQQLSVVQISIIDKAEDILTLKEYRTLIGVTDKSLQIRDLLNTIIRKSSEDCKKFLQIMQQHFPLITELLQSSSQGQCHQFVCAEEGSNVVAPLVSHVNTGPFNMDVTLRTSNELKALDQLDAQKSQNYSACGQTASPYSVQAQFGTTSSVRAYKVCQRKLRSVSSNVHQSQLKRGLHPYQVPERCDGGTTAPPGGLRRAFTQLFIA